MNNLNQTMLEGNLVDVPELKNTANGFPYLNFTLGVNSSYKDKNGEWQKEVTFVDAVAYGKQAEIISKKAEKGSPLRLVGKIKQNKWVDKDGKNHSNLSLFTEQVEINPDRNGRTQNQLNQTIIEGNLVAPAEIKSTQNGNVISKFSLAVNNSYKGKDGNWVNNPSFIDIETWGEGRAKFLQEKSDKGKTARIIGHLKQDRWEDADGKKHSKVYLVADDISFKSREKSIKKEQTQKTKEDSLGLGM